MVKFSKCIHIIHYAGSTKKKKYLIIFIDVKKAFDKMSHQFLTKFSHFFFLAAAGLRCYTWIFSSCSKGELLSSFAVLRLLTTVVSFIVENGL